MDKNRNIISRHAYRHGLNVALPKTGNYASKFNLFNRLNVTSDTPWGHLDMDVFTLHSRWNYNEVIGLMGPSVRTFSILRQPVDLFLSLFSYSKLHYNYKTDLKGLIKLFLENPRKIPKILQKRSYGFVGRNQIAWDWGFDPKDFDRLTDSDFIQQRIAKLDSEFHLV